MNKTLQEMVDILSMMEIFEEKSSNQHGSYLKYFDREGFDVTEEVERLKKLLQKTYKAGYEKGRSDCPCLDKYKRNKQKD